MNSWNEWDTFFRPFDLKYFERVNSPITYFDELSIEEFPEERFLNYLVKPKNSGLLAIGDLKVLRPALTQALNSALQILGRGERNSRYMYVTFDQGMVMPGDSLRTGGWHTDGLQGDEVTVKRPGDFQLLWSDNLPTEYAKQGFDVSGLDVSRHNVFNWLSKQVKEDKIRPFPTNRFVAHNSYLVHRSAVAKVPTYRRFIRISFTHIPITSETMTINPSIDYDYEIHTTSGEIPSHLK